MTARRFHLSPSWSIATLLLTVVLPPASVAQQVVRQPAIMTSDPIRWLDFLRISATVRSCTTRLAIVLCTSLLLFMVPCFAGKSPGSVHKGRNVIIFVADGLRNTSVNETDTPTMFRIRAEGVYFPNSHSLFPTFTMSNASAIATGHYLGDTGNFSNVVYTGYPIFESLNFGRTAGTVTPFLEDNQRLADLNSHFGGNYLNQITLVALARKQGYRTAVVGKVGPAAIQDIEEFRPFRHEFLASEGVVIDDSTGKEGLPGHRSGLPLPPEIEAALAAAKMSTVAPDRSNGCGKTEACNNGYAGGNAKPGTTAANTRQQQYFADTVTKVILPSFVKGGKPFLVVYWSRDPDGTQHYQGDSLNGLTPGINGETSRRALKNVDDNLKQILDYVNADPKLRENTDVFVTSDHGFATISRHEIDSAMHVTQSYSATYQYRLDSGDALEIPKGYLPVGFLAIDLARALGMKLYDPDKPIADGKGVVGYEEVDPTISQPTATLVQRPSSGNGLIGDNVHRPDGSDAKVIVSAYGGSDLIYVPDSDVGRVRAIVDFLTHQDYVGGIFVDADRYGNVPGALSLRAIGLVGSTPLPRPAVVVSFKVFYLEPGELQTAVQISDTILQEGQGMHGGFGRDSTFNNMAAIGPDFKAHYVDPSPVSNADIAVTVEQILSLDLPGAIHLRGRVLREALKGGPPALPFVRRTVASSKANRRRTMLQYQQMGEQRYFDRACFVDSGNGCSASCSF
jgi:arylsulfatase A-like enzyme